jgi:hypothetical protein
MAKDILRRFMPEYLRIWGLLEEKQKATNDYHARKLANWKRIAESGNVTDPRTPDASRIGSEDPRAQIRFGAKGKDGYNYDKGYGDIRMTGDDSVQIELRSLPVETALRILAAISDGAKS